MKRRMLMLMGLALGMLAGEAAGQTSSLRKRHATTQPVQQRNREAKEYQGNPTLDKYSMIAVRVRPPKKFKVNDLITIIVRQQTKFESDGEVKSKKEADIESKIDAFINIIDGGLGAALFRRGKPNIKYELSTELKNKAKKDREDRLTTRITAKILDVKPNGNMVLEAASEQVFEDEHTRVTLTGMCRSVDVTPDNTVLSTQLADLNVRIQNRGAVRDGSSRGWLQKFMDKTKPF